MPVGKMNDDVLRKLDTGFDVISRDAINGLESGEAIAMYVLMATRPQDWTFRKLWIKERTGFGEDRYKKGRDELVAKGHWVSEPVPRDNGRLSGRIIWFQPIPPKYLKTELRENPNLGKTAPLKIKDKQQLKNKDTDYSFEFDSFWSKYPSKVKGNKGKAWGAWKRLSASDRRVAMVEMYSFFSERLEINRNYYMYASTYLNGKRWEDELGSQPKEVFGAGAI